MSSDLDSHVVSGILHCYVAFDWGEEVDLDRARGLVPAQQRDLSRRRRTPPSIAYRPPPLRFHLNPLHVAWPGLGERESVAEATVFDFGAVSVAAHVPLELNSEELIQLAAGLADPEPLIVVARAAIEPLYANLKPAIQHPRFGALSEEYFVFQLLPCAALAPTLLLGKHAGWLARLLRLEAGPLSDEEVAEATRLHLSYSPEDLFVAEWSAAVLVDRDCDETLQTIELANTQLLEFRHLDDDLDQRLADAYRVIHPLVRSWLPFWRTQTRPLRILGDLRIGANELFDRTTNVLKLVGDQYLARLHRILAARFHFQELEGSIRQSLDVIQGVYGILSDQAANYRTELLEIIIIALIGFEIVAAFWR